jgi:hypothetical protein
MGLMAINAIQCCAISAFEGQNKPTVSGEPSVIYSAGKEEFDAYDAAKKESDPQRRAAKLYEFIQKYPKSPFIELISNENYEGIKSIENEYSAYYGALQEPDLEKRAAMLLEFDREYPDSIFKANVDNDYLGMLNSLHRDKKYELVYSLGEKWLTAPNNRNAHVFVGEAARQLQKYQRCGECLEAGYEINPSSNLAREIQVCYRKANNREKMSEWAEKLFKMPEFDGDYMLRYENALICYNDRNLPKAAGYAQLALKSIDLVKQPDEKGQEQLRNVHRICHHIVASSLVDKGTFTEAISEFEQAIAAEKYGEGYYGIGLCFDKKKNIEEAMLYYAAAELMDRNAALKAKERLDVLYKALHNDTLIGIDKIYSKARKMLEDQSG